MVTDSSTRQKLEQRRLSRSRVVLTARYASQNLNLEGHVTDVTSDGLFFNSEFLDDQGEIAHVWVDVPSRLEPLELRGEVRWVSDSLHGGGMGIRLVDVSLEDRAFLARLPQLLRAIEAGGGREGRA